MYTGHVAIALATRGLRSDLPLIVLVFVAQACDWVELAARLFVSRPLAEVYSHALPFTVLAASGVAVLVWLRWRSVGASLTVMAVYLSHPAADYVTGFKPLWSGGPNVGLQVVERPVVDFFIQASLCAVGVALYSRSFPVGRARVRRLVIAVPLAFLISLQALGNVMLQLFRERRDRDVSTTQQSRDCGPPRVTHLPNPRDRELCS